VERTNANAIWERQYLRQHQHQHQHQTPTPTNSMDPSFYSAAACLAPPNLSEYHQDYQAYIQAFELYLSFLERHPGLRSLDTGKPVKQPSKASLDKTLARVKLAMASKPVSVDDSDEDSDWTMHRTPGVSIAPSVIEPHPPTPPVPAPHARGLEVSPPGQPPSIVPKVPLPTAPFTVGITDVGGAQLMGKKKCRNLLSMYCDAELCAYLIALDACNREEAKFRSMLSSLERKWKKNGRQLLGLGKLQPVVRTGLKRPDNPGRMDHPDFDALWESGASGSEVLD